MKNSLKSRTIFLCQNSLLCKLRFLRYFVFLFLFSSKGEAFTQQLSVCYFDSWELPYKVPRPPNFLLGRGDEKVEKGWMLFYQRSIFNLGGIMPVCFGGDVAKWNLKGESLYTASLFLSSRFRTFQILFFRPYAEYSIFGPTFISKTEFGSVDFKKKWLFQNFFGLGVEMGETIGFQIDLKMFRYFLADFSRPKEGFQVPLLLSVGCFF